MLETKKPFPQFIDKNPKKHFHWILFIVLSLAIVVGLLIAIQKFKTNEEIDSIAPQVKNIIQIQWASLQSNDAHCIMCL